MQGIRYSAIGWLAVAMCGGVGAAHAMAGLGEVFRSPFFAPDGAPCIGDVNGDGHPELILTTWDHAAVYTGGPPFELQADWTLTNPTWPGNVVQGAACTDIADIDGDGLPELLIGTWGSSVLTFHYAAGTWEQGETLPWMNYGCYAVAGDADGIPGNEVVAGSVFGHFYIVRHQATGYEVVYQSPLLTPPDDGPVTVLGIADTNGNGQPEIVTYMGYGAIDVFEPGPDGPVMIAQTTFDNGTDPGQQGARKGLLYDVDRDGQTEIVYADVAGTLRMLKHDGTSYLVMEIANLGWNPFSLAAGDADGDGGTELLAGGLGGELAVVATDTGCVTYLGNYGSHVQVAMGDVTADGRDELVVGKHLGQFHVLTYGPPSDLWARWGFEEYPAGPVGSPGTCAESWLVPPGSVPPEIISGASAEGVRHLSFAAVPALACATERDLTDAVSMPPDELWDLSLAFKVNLTPGAELRVVLEDRNLASAGSPGPCVQFAILHTGDRVVPALWDADGYSDLSAALGITTLAPDTWHQLVICCDPVSATIRRVWLYVPGLGPRHAEDLMLPFGGAAGTGAEQGRPEYLSVALLAGSGGTSIADIDDIVIERGYSTDNQPWDDLRACLQHIYRDGWPQMYIDSANSVLANPSFTTEDYAAFFAAYLSDDGLNKNIINYLGYPVFGWFDEQVHARLQHATLAAFRQAAFDIVATHPEDLGDVFLQDYQLGETCACLHYWINESRDYGQMLTLEDWQTVDEDYLAHFAAFPQYFDAAVTFDNHTQPWLGAVRAQAWLVTQNIFPLEGSRKAELVAAYGLTGERADLFAQTGVVLLDNNMYHPNLEALIIDVLLALPPDASILQTISCEETLFYGSWADPFRMWGNYVNINNGDPAAGQVNEFPSDVAPAYAPLMAGAVVHEIMHAVDAYHTYGSGCHNMSGFPRAARL